MNSHRSTLETIGAILSFKSDTDLLKNKITNDDIDWDDIVKIASGHLVLPALYYRLKEKSLSQLIPEELLIYLEEIATINHNRNLSILNQVKTISQLFNENHIDHVFLKGSALLAANYYNDIGERMIGDIDILVDLKQLQEARKALMEIGYLDAETSFGYVLVTSDFRHLNRLVEKTKMAAVEIHRKVLKKPYLHYLQPDLLLKEKRSVNGVAVLSPKHLLEHNILNLQINDAGNRRVYSHFRTAYDTILILKQHPEINIQTEYSSSFFQNYFTINTLILNDFKFEPTTLRAKIQGGVYSFKTRHLKLYFLWSKLVSFINFFSFLLSRSWHFLTNKRYRKGAIKYGQKIYSEQKSKF